jgi:glycosyltransferase involved in cell wall biosynthesis
MRRICIVTSTHLCRNPRVVKEADALAARGHTVRVVCVQWGAREAAEDQSIARAGGFRLDPLEVDKHAWPGVARWLVAGLTQRVCEAAYRVTRGHALLDAVFSRYAQALARKSTKEPADCYIAHNLPALPAAVRAARRYGAVLGFDAEDFHRGEFPADRQATPLARMTRQVEERYIPMCDFVTAASVGIADAYARSLSIPMPAPILNVFPLAERDVHLPKDQLATEKDGDFFSLYWFSQTIGGDRGLQDVLRALAGLDEKIHLTIRGSWSAGFEDSFWDLARKLGVAERVHVRGIVPAREMVVRAARHEAGLALEQPISENKWLCLANKMFTYFTAGIPVVATATAGQRWLAERVPDAVRLVGPGDAGALTRAIDGLYRNQAFYQRARAAASRAAETEFNWELESRKLVRVVEEVLQKGHGGVGVGSQEGAQRS